VKLRLTIVRTATDPFLPQFNLTLKVQGNEGCSSSTELFSDTGYAGRRKVRQIARKLEEDVAFRVLAANQRPDFRTLSDFRKQHLTALGCTPLSPPDHQLHSPVVPAAPRGRPPASLSVADRMRRTLPACRRTGARNVGDGATPGAKRSSNRCSARASRPACRQAGPRLSTIPAGRDAAGVWGVDAHLYHPSCPEALAGPQLSAPRSRTPPAHAERQPEGEAERTAIATGQQADPCAAEYGHNPQSRSWFDQLNVGQAPSQGSSGEPRLTSR
jgi:hypothetical protein